MYNKKLQRMANAPGRFEIKYFFQKKSVFNLNLSAATAGLRIRNLLQVRIMMNSNKTAVIISIFCFILLFSACIPKQTIHKSKCTEPSFTDGKAKHQSEKYTIQVIATKSKEKAHEIVNMLGESGYDSYVIEVEIVGIKIYRVRVGRLPKKDIDQLYENLSNSNVGKRFTLKVTKAN